MGQREKMGRRRSREVWVSVGGRRGRRGREEEEEREGDREHQEIPNSPSIFCQAAQRVAGSHGPGGGWKECSAELLGPLGPQACLLQGPHSWCLLP